MEHKLFIDGQWVDGGPLIEVTNKYTGEVIGALPSARREEVDAALAAAERAARVMAELPAYRRSEILARGLAPNSGASARSWRARSPPRPARRSSTRASKSIAAPPRSRSRPRKRGASTARPMPLDGVPAGEGYFGFYVAPPGRA